MKEAGCVDSSNQLQCLSLCTGYSGLEIGLERAGVPLRPVAYLEREAFAAANLVAKIEAGEMAAAPVWTDVATFPYSDFHGRVDILVAGYPCQAYSTAGERKGEADSRYLWEFIANGIAACQPGFVFAENVEGHLSLGIEDVFKDMGRMGYQYTAGLFSAEEVGASHQRNRLFWLAYSGSTRSKAWLSRSKQWQKGNTEVTDDGRARRWPARPNKQQYTWEEPRTVGDAGSTKPHRLPDSSRQNISKTRNTNERQTKSQLGGTTNGTRCWPDPVAYRVDRLRLLGNGVVPQTAAKAWITLWNELMTDELTK